MQPEIPLIKKVERIDSSEYVICSQGVHFLKSLKSKKLRILFNVTHQPKTLSQFNRWMVNQTSNLTQEVNPFACLTISSAVKAISEDRVIVILTAYQCFQQQPFMVLLGYLGASVFMYHHFQAQLNNKSPLVMLLSKLWKLLQTTDINRLELSHSKGYAKNPYFLCLLSQNNKKSKLNQVFRCKQGQEDLNRAVDALIEYFPQRREIVLPLNMNSVSAIGNQFQNSVLGRTVFNFQFTGGTLQNLCFDCCQAFNNHKKINLSDLYIKIIENQKTMLQGDSLQHYMNLVSQQYFNGGKVDIDSQSNFPLSPKEFTNLCAEIQEKVLSNSIQSATSCMTLIEYINLEKALRKFFRAKRSELQEINDKKCEQLCNQCFNMLDNLTECDSDPQSLYNLFRDIQNKIGLFSSECQILTNEDPIHRLLWNSQLRLIQRQFGHLEGKTKQIIEDLQYREQQQRVQIQTLRYNLRVSQNQLRSIQFEYQVQSDILNQTRVKMFSQAGQEEPQITFSLEANKLRRKLQQMEEEIKDKGSNIEELQNILEKIQGAREKEKSKFKFSKEIQELMKQVSQKVNSYFSVVRQAREINQIEQQIKKKFAKQRQVLMEEKSQLKQELAKRMGQIQRLVNQKNMLQQIVQQSKYSIQVFRNKSLKDKQSINLLEKNNTQLNCMLAQTQSQLEQYKKGLSLAGQVVSKGAKVQILVKFCKVMQSSELRELLRPFLKK